MSTLAEILQAAASLSTAEKEALLLLLAKRRRMARQGRAPARRRPEQIGAWIVEEDADLHLELSES